MASMIGRNFFIRGFCTLLASVFLCGISAAAREIDAVHISSVPRGDAKSPVSLRLLDSGFSAVEVEDFGYHGIPYSLSYYAKWKLSDLNNVSAVYSCDTHRKELFLGIYWPRRGDCSGSVQISVDSERFLDMVEKDLRKNGLRFDRNDWENKYYLSVKRYGLGLDAEYAAAVLALRGASWLLNNSSGESASTLFNNVDSNHFLRIKSVEGQHDVELTKFSELLSYARVEVEKRTAVKIDEDRQKARIAMLLWAGVIALGLLVLYALVRFVRKHYARVKARTKEKVENIAHTAADSVAKIQQANERRKVRAVVIDEAIREITRQSVSSADPSSKDVLLAELRKALKSGNHELADALQKAIRKA